MRFAGNALNQHIDHKQMDEFEQMFYLFLLMLPLSKHDHRKTMTGKTKFQGNSRPKDVYLDRK